MTDISTIYRGPDDGGNYEGEWADDLSGYYLISDVGRKRKHNEDSCILCLPDDETVRAQKGIIVAVADGMGGASAGEYASRLTLTELVKHYYDNESDSIPDALQLAIKKANSKVFEESEADIELQGMGTTCSAVVLHGANAYIGQVGDSRVYLLRESNGLTQLTNDHSLVWEQMKAGIITEEEAKHHSLRNLITRAVGIKSEVEVDLFSFILEKDDTLLICSDGLCGMVDDPGIHEGMKANTLKDIGQLLVGKALDGGGTDNITAALFQATGSLPKHEVQEGCEEIITPSANTGIIQRIKNLFFS
jgi:serine/threonine protein phosphatase PrpC